MRIIADLHIHSKYSRAVSPKMDLHGIGTWASYKGIDLIATGDWTHPMWFREIVTQLTETSPGIFELKNPTLQQKRKVRFILSVEISSIFSQGGKGRRIHNVVLAPSINTVEKINKEFVRRGTNIMSDGRPITGMSAKDLLEMILSIDARCMLIPAHIWTPWFSLFGSKSGFDSIEECFGTEGAKNIYAIETGLSSDPIMNWQIEDLKSRSIISSSDAHSGPKLAREATVFVSTNQQPITSYSYDDITDAIKQKQDGKLKIGYTIEFFPEEGKYHWTGHRACNVKYSPLQEKEKGVICPVCKQPLTVGVESRVMQLAKTILSPEDLLFAQNKNGLTFIEDKEKKRRPFVSIIPLQEVFNELEGGSPIKGERAYQKAVSELGAEFDILLHTPYAQIETFGGPRLRRAIEIIRTRQAYVDPGYDGVFGVVKIFKDEKKESETNPIDENKTQAKLF